MISVLQLLDGAQFLNATYVAAASGCFLWAWVSAEKLAEQKQFV